MKWRAVWSENMVMEVKQKGKKYFRCKFCRILYKEKKLAEEHEAFCIGYNALAFESSTAKEMKGGKT